MDTTLRPAVRTATEDWPGPEIRALLELMVEKGASDLHLHCGSPPQVRIAGSLTALRLDETDPDHRGALPDETPLSPTDTERIARNLLTEKQFERFTRQGDLDFSFELPEVARFRGSVYTQRGMISLALRVVPLTIPSLDALGLPPIIRDLAFKAQGLVLITGPTGAGKSTTLAAMIDLINRTVARHIVTIEDPIEFIHESRRALVDQREVSTDTPSFHQALRAVFRQDPDVVLIGELRDLDSIRTALTLAETGHLTLATVHANSAAQTINRLIDAFPSGQQEQIRSQLSLTLEGVITQALIPRLKGGRILALEIMLGISSVRALIRDGKIHQLYGIIQAGQSHGMRTMNSSLLDLVRKREIDTMHALSVSPKPDELSGYLA